MKRFCALLAFVPITAGLMLLWPVDEVLTADATASTATVSSAVASASSAIATASSAIATASSAIATASSAIATASSAIATDQSATATDQSGIATVPSGVATDPLSVAEVACDNDTSDLCDTTSGIDNDGCCTVRVASALGLGHGRGRSSGRGAHRDGFGPLAARPRTVGAKMVEKIILTAMSMFFEKLELAVYMSLYKLKILYTTLIAPVLRSI